MRVLAIETSCDETAIAVLQYADSLVERVLVNVVYSQIQEHAQHRGVVPEIAARTHYAKISSLLNDALKQLAKRLGMEEDHLDSYSSQDSKRAGTSSEGLLHRYGITHIAVTSGPGLVGSLLIGVMFARGLALSNNLPLFAINHLEGHLLSARMEFSKLAFPYLGLLVSGGHTQLIIARNLREYKIIGKTLDDALGECFDKVAKMLDISGGGATIERLARQGDATKIELPRPMLHTNDCNFSFSGLKTAVRLKIESLKVQRNLTNQDKSDIAASLQQAILDILLAKISKALKEFSRQESIEGANSIDKIAVSMCGGVANNLYLRDKLEKNFEKECVFYFPKGEYCSDNAAMIGWVAVEYLRQGFNNCDKQFPTLSRWSLEKL